MLKYLCFPVKQCLDYYIPLILYCLSGENNLGRYYPRDRIVCMFCTTVQSSIMHDRNILAQLTKCVGCKSTLKIICNCLRNLKLLNGLWYSINEDVIIRTDHDDLDDSTVEKEHELH